MATRERAIPGRLQGRPRDKAGRPIPWFAAEVAPGEYDLRVAEGWKIHAALGAKGRGRGGQGARPGLCWVCGFPFERQEVRAFVIGPMCAINHISAEPPCHEGCATYSATACPFLTAPAMERRRGPASPLPEGNAPPGGVMIERNPGVTLVWVTTYRAWRTVRDPAGGLVFDIGEPLRVAWWARGVAASRLEVLESIDSGLPALAAIAEETGAQAELADRVLALGPLLPGPGPDDPSAAEALEAWAAGNAWRREAAR